jgi:hypothetical protein
LATADSTSRGIGGSVTEATGSTAQAESWRGALGTHQLGSFHLSALVAPRASQTTVSGNGATAVSTSRAVSQDGEGPKLGGLQLGEDVFGEYFRMIQPANANPNESDGLASAFGGNVTSAKGSALPHNPDLLLGEFGLGEDDLSEGPASSYTYAGSSSTLAEGSGTEAYRYIEYWAVDSRVVPVVVEETRNWQELTLMWRSKRADVEEALRPLDTRAGKVELVEYPDGAYKVISRGDEENAVRLTPPTARRDLRSVRNFYVEEYNEELEDQNADIYRVEINFIAAEEKGT